MERDFAGRTLTISGRGRVSADPDLAILRLRIVSRKDSYAASMRELNRRVETLRGDLGDAEVGRKVAKTVDFEVRTDYGSERGGKRVFRGYETSHGLRLELPFDREILNRVLDRLARSASEARVDVAFDVSDPEALRRRAVEAAVEDALRCARILAQASGVALGEILRVDYHHVDVRVRFAGSASYDLVGAAPTPDTEPEVLRAEESVTVVWNIS